MLRQRGLHVRLALGDLRGRPFGPGDALRDPRADETFEESIIDWDVLGDPAHAAWAALYQRLLTARREFVTPRLPASPEPAPGLFGDSGLDLRWRLSGGAVLTLLANLGPEPLRLETAAADEGRLLHAEPVTADTITDTLPPWSVIWRLVPNR